MFLCIENIIQDTSFENADINWLRQTYIFYFIFKDCRHCYCTETCLFYKKRYNSLHLCKYPLSFIEALQNIVKTRRRGIDFGKVGNRSIFRIK